MGSEAVLLARDAGEVYELGKFAGTWAGASGLDWTRTDFATFEKRVLDALLGEDREYEREYDTDLIYDSGGSRRVVTHGKGVAHCHAVAVEVFAFCERHDWKVECMSDERLWDRQGREFKVVGNRYDAAKEPSARSTARYR